MPLIHLIFSMRDRKNIFIRSSWSIWLQVVWFLSVVLCQVALPAKQGMTLLTLHTFFFKYLLLTVINSRSKVCSHIVWTLFVLESLCRTAPVLLPPPSTPFNPKTPLDAGQPFPPPTRQPRALSLPPLPVYSSLCFLAVL